MLIPLRTDRPSRRTPLVTQGLVLANLAVYLVGAAGYYFDVFKNPQVLADFGHFDPSHFKFWQLFSYQFLHDPHGILHIAFNMLFLWVFGTAVEDRLGRIGFLVFYLIGGAVAALAHCLVSSAPVIGASGSIAAVTGAFLALFPRSRIQILLFFLIIGVYSIPSLWFIGFYIGVDALRQLWDLLGRGGSHVAYMAHLAGYAYGFGVGFTLLATGILKREEFDVFFLFTQARRRARFRAANRGTPAGAWDSAQADTARRMQRRTARGPKAAPPDDRRSRLRARVTERLAAGDVKAAAAAYRQLLADVRNEDGGGTMDDPTAIAFGEQVQLDVASQLYAQGAYVDAATAYEVLLERHAASRKADEVRLILGLIYARHLDRPDRARALIEQARPGLHEQSHARLADQILAELAA
jgi:membrane associated rhomboid family serine protease